MVLYADCNDIAVKIFVPLNQSPALCHHIGRKHMQKKKKHCNSMFRTIIRICNCTIFLCDFSINSTSTVRTPLADPSWTPKETSRGSERWAQQMRIARTAQSFDAKLKCQQSLRIAKITRPTALETLTTSSQRISRNLRLLIPNSRLNTPRFGRVCNWLEGESATLFVFVVEDLQLRRI